MMSPLEVSKTRKLFQTLPAAQALRNYISYCELCKCASPTGPGGPEVWLPCTQVGPRAGGVPSWSPDMPQNCYGHSQRVRQNVLRVGRHQVKKQRKYQKVNYLDVPVHLSHQKPPFTVGFSETVPSGPPKSHLLFKEAHVPADACSPGEPSPSEIRFLRPRLGK